MFENEVRNNLLNILVEETNCPKYRDKINLKNILQEDTSKFKVSDTLINTLYQLSLNKYKDLDTSSIEKSKGDVTKFEGYKLIYDAIQAFDKDIRSSVCVLKNTEIFYDLIDTSKETLHLLETNKRDYQLGYVKNIKLVQVSYSTAILSLLILINLIISEATNNSLNSDNVNFKYTENLDKTQDYIVSVNLKAYNDSVKNGAISKLVKESSKSPINESIITPIVACSIPALIILLVKTLRSLIYFVYEMRISIVSYLDNIKEYLENNKNNISNNPYIENDRKKEIIAKQKKSIVKLNKFINFFQLKFIKADKKAKVETMKKIQINEIKDKLNDVSDNNNTFNLI